MVYASVPTKDLARDRHTSDLYHDMRILQIAFNTLRLKQNPESAASACPIHNDVADFPTATRPSLSAVSFSEKGTKT